MRPLVEVFVFDNRAYFNPIQLLSISRETNTIVSQESGALAYCRTADEACVHIRGTAMTVKDHFELLSLYNQKMNANIYQAAGHLPHEDLVENRGAFFGSILGTLNHIVVGDTVWLQRFSTHPTSQHCLREVAELPSPSRLDHIVFDNLGDLKEHRTWLDLQIINWLAALSCADLDSVFSFHSMKGIPSSKRFSSVIFHFFNHQTHHRGQVSTLLAQAGVDIGVTDLLVMVPEDVQES